MQEILIVWRALNCFCSEQPNKREYVLLELLNIVSIEVDGWRLFELEPLVKIVQHEVVAPQHRIKLDLIIQSQPSFQNCFLCCLGQLFHSGKNVVSVDLAGRVEQVGLALFLQDRVELLLLLAAVFPFSEAPIKQQVVFPFSSILPFQLFPENPPSVDLLHFDDRIQPFILLSQHFQSKPKVLHIFFLCRVVRDVSPRQNLGDVTLSAKSLPISQQIGHPFLFYNNVFVECEGIGVVDYVVSCQKHILIAPVSYPNDIVTQRRSFPVLFKYFDELSDGELVFVEEGYPEEAEMAEVRKGLDFVPGEVDLDEAEALRKRGNIQREGRVQDQELKGVVLGYELLQRDSVHVIFWTYYIHSNSHKAMTEQSCYKLRVTYQKVKRQGWQCDLNFEVFIRIASSQKLITYFMSMSQRTTSLFSRHKSHGKSLNTESSFFTPKIHRNAPSAHISHQQSSASKYQHTAKPRLNSAHSEVENTHKHQHKCISVGGFSSFSPNTHKKGKEEQLRETDDSVRPKHRKRGLTIKSFKILKQLGRGKHGTVFLAMHKESGFIGALKVFSKQQLRGQNEAETIKIQEQLIRQFKIQSFVCHQHIIRLYSVFADQDFIYAFMELGSDGQLYQIFQKKKKLKEETISFVMRSLLEGLNNLHSQGIIHRDIKPENIVLIHGFPKICDFGQSNFFSKEKGQLRETLCGTPLYLSPQILVGDKYDEKIDIWALGAMAYQLFTSMNPFNIKNKDELKRIITQEFKMSEGSLEICNFLTHCLKKHPLQRPSSAKLLKHPFILKWKELETAEELCSHQLQ